MSCELTDVTGPLSVTAHFALDSYPITATADPAAGGTASCDPNPVPHGGSSTCTASPATGYSFTGWSGACTGMSCELTAVTGPLSVTAHFALNSYVVVTTAVNGTITSPPNPEVTHGSTTTVTGEASEGHYFASVSGCGGDAQSNADQQITTFSYQTGAITAACEVSAVFLPLTSTVTTITGIDPPGAQTVGQAYTVSVRVDGFGPTGSVEVSNGEQTCHAEIDGAGLGSCALFSQTTGSKSITATYPGDDGHDASVALPVGYEITRIGTTLSSLAADSGFPDIRVGDSLALSWTLVADSAFGDITGQVTVSLGGDILCSAGWSAGFCLLDEITVAGALTLSFEYEGNDRYAPAQNALEIQVLEQPREFAFDAAISKRVTHSLVLLDGDDLVRFRILVENVGPDDIVGALVSDPLPVRLVEAEWTCAEFDGGQCASASGQGDILEEAVNLPVGASVVFTLEGRVVDLPEGGLVNLALVDVEDDVDQSNNVGGTTYQRCSASNLQTDPDDEDLREHACIFLDGFEGSEP
jgi:uncharacterized repeat protein (TIGR02543 family)/uncharacterized repeat protein (TIGR01451 family)